MLIFEKDVHHILTLGLVFSAVFGIIRLFYDPGGVCTGEPAAGPPVRIIYEDLCDCPYLFE